MCWKRLLKVPWTARKSNQSILKEISPGCSLEGLMLNLKLQYSCKELTHWKRPWCWDRLRAGGEGDNRGWGSWMASLTRWTWVWVNSGSWWWTARPGVLWFVGSQRVGHDWATKLNWTEHKLIVTIKQMRWIYLLPHQCVNTCEFMGFQNWKVLEKLSSPLSHLMRPVFMEQQILALNSITHYHHNFCT